jgi:hypothetical protein
VKRTLIYTEGNTRKRGYLLDKKLVFSLSLSLIRPVAQFFLYVLLLLRLSFFCFASSSFRYFLSCRPNVLHPHWGDWQSRRPLESWGATPLRNEGGKQTFLVLVFWPERVCQPAPASLSLVHNYVSELKQVCVCVCAVPLSLFIRCETTK